MTRRSFTRFRTVRHFSLRRGAVLLLSVLVWFTSLHGARAATTVRVVETWPSGEEIVLGRNQNFYLRLAYDTDTPVGIWVRALRDGKRVNVGSSPSQTYLGRGETFVWFFLMQPDDAVDEIQIAAGDGSTDHTPVVAVWRGQVAGSSETAAAQVQPAWVAEMRARTKAVQDGAYQARMREPVSVWDTVVVGGFILAMLALGGMSLLAPLWGLWRWRGGWRVAAVVPGAIMVFVLLRIVFDVSRDPTAHNLWPFEIVMAGGLSAALMALLWYARRLSGGGRRRNSGPGRFFHSK